MTTTAIIGAGLTGALIALRLADAGRHVVIFESESRPLRGASFVNEGKVHLGYTYAGDSSLRTAQRMIDGAIRFESDLAPWVARDTLQSIISDGVDYLVPADSQLSAAAIRTHFQAVTNRWRAAEIQTGHRYLGSPLRQGWWDLEPDIFEGGLPDLQASFGSEERCVDAKIIAREISQALRSHPRIEVHISTPIVRAEDSKGQWRLHGHDQAFGPFDTIVNCSWQNRLKVDATSGFQPTMNWITRYKCNVDFQVPPEVIASSRFRNFTCVLGAFGDAIFFPTGRVYLSWYPSGLLLADTSMSPQAPSLTEAVRKDVLEATFKHLSAFLPAINGLRTYASPNDVVGGFIVAPGRSDITDPKSQLHNRSESGIRQRAPGYLSVDTGKYTLAPPLARDCVDLMLTGAADRALAI